MKENCICGMVTNRTVKTEEIVNKNTKIRAMKHEKTDHDTTIKGDRKVSRTMRTEEGDINNKELDKNKKVVLGVLAGMILMVVTTVTASVLIITGMI